MQIRAKFTGAWAAMLLLVLGVLAPTICVLWFMNQTARTQADSARQSVIGAYRGQLWLIRDRVDSYWAGRGAALQALSGLGAPGFGRAIGQHLADSVVMLDAGGRLAYPSSSTAPVGSPFNLRPDWVAAEGMEIAGQRANAAAAYGRIADAASDPSLRARAAQAEIRCLVRSVRKNRRSGRS